MSLSPEAHKLTLDAASSLKEVAASHFLPGRLLLQPVYLLFSQNQKFVAIKSTLDFFTQADLRKLQPIKTLFVPAIAASLAEKRNHGATLRSFLDQVLSEKAKTQRAGLSATLTPSDTEISAEAFRQMPPAWEPDKKVSHDEAIAWVEGFCTVMPHALMDAVRLQGLDEFRARVLTGSWAVLLALLTGFADAPLLDRLRIAPLLAAAGEAPEPLGELEELLETAARWTSRYSDGIELSEVLKDEIDRGSQRVVQRIKGLPEEVLKHG